MNRKVTEQDLNYMQLAIEEGLKHAGLTNPNPSVGTLIVKNGQIVAKACTAIGGRPHSEIVALRKSQGQAKDSDVYVTLEPCAHYGVTPPCAEKLSEAGVRRVFVGAKDPNPKVNGKGIRILRKNGIEVFTNVLPKESAEVNEWFFKKFHSAYPYVVLKSAISLDGKIATYTGKSKWISSPDSLKYVHHLRQRFDAIVVGTHTLTMDNPTLNVRLPKAKRTPDKIILDRKGELDQKLNIFQTLENERIFYFSHIKRKTPLKNKNILAFQVGSKKGKLNLDEILVILKEHNIFSVLVEGGGQLNASLLEAGLVDKVIFVIAPKIIGGEKSVSVVRGKNIDDLKEAITLKDISLRQFGNDYIYTGFVKRYF